MKVKFSRPSFTKKNDNNILKLNDDFTQKKNQKKSLIFKKLDQGEVLFRIEQKIRQAYLKKEKEFEKKAGNIIKNNKYNHTNQAQNNYNKMFIENITSLKSHRIRLKYVEILIEINPKEMLKKYYNKKISYNKLKSLTKTFDENIIFFPNYFVNENVYSIMEKLLEDKEKLILRTEKDNKKYFMHYKTLKNKKINDYQGISNKILESFSDKNNNIDLEDNLKNLNDESSSDKNIDSNNSSKQVKKLINNINNNFEKKCINKKKSNKNILKLITKNYEIKNKKEEQNIQFKRMKSETKPITFNKNKIIEKIYLDDFLYKKAGLLKNNHRNENNKIKENNIYFHTISNSNKNDNNPINKYIYKNVKQKGKSSKNYKSIEVFIYNFIKQRNLKRKKKIKPIIINSVNDYELEKHQKILSLLKAKEKTITKCFSLSSSKKKLNKNFIQNDGFTTEITPIKDILNRNKIKEGEIFHSTEYTNKNNLQSPHLFYNKNGLKYINYESMSERIKINIGTLLRNRDYKYIYPLLKTKS